MNSEVRYLVNQLEAGDSSDFSSLLDGYEVPIDGYVAILDEQGRVLESNDEDRFPKGAFYLSMLGYDPEDFGGEEYVGELFDEMADIDEVNEFQAVDEDGVEGNSGRYAAMRE